MTPEAMMALRRAATVAHTLPGVRLRLREGERTLLEVSSHEQPAGPAMSACAFRRAVGCAHEHLKRGSRVSFMGLPEDFAPAIEVGLTRGGVVRPHGLYRVRGGALEIHAFATTLPVRQCMEVRERCTGDTDGGDVRFHRDAATEITLVHVATPQLPEPIERHPLLDDLLLACLTEEIVEQLT